MIIFFHLMYIFAWFLLSVF